MLVAIIMNYQELLFQKLLLLHSKFFCSTLDPIFAFSFELFKIGANRERFYSCFKGRDFFVTLFQGRLRDGGRFNSYLNQTSYSFFTAHIKFYTAHG